MRTEKKGEICPKLVNQPYRNKMNGGKGGRGKTRALLGRASKYSDPFGKQKIFWGVTRGGDQRPGVGTKKGTKTKPGQPWTCGVKKV